MAVGKTANGGSIEWYRTFEPAQKLAKQTGKPMLIDFTASWCKPCQEMEASFWSQPEIVEVSRKFVCVSLNFDQRGPETARYKVDRIPAVAVTDSWGNLLASKFGFGPGTARSLTQILQAIPADFSPISEWNDILARDRDNSIALIKVGDFYREHGIMDLSTAFFKRALKTHDVAEDQKARESILITIGLNHLKSKNYDDARKIFETCLKEIPNGDQVDTAFLGIMTAQINKRKVKDAEKTLAQFRTSYPNSPVIQQAEQMLQQTGNPKD
jgi:thioredoxin-like negative regulator of GroEL